MLVKSHEDRGIFMVEDGCSCAMDLCIVVAMGSLVVIVSSIVGHRNQWFMIPKHMKVVV